MASYAELNPLPRLLMGPGPVNADPRVLRAMSAPLLGQFDPQFRAYMHETMVLYRTVFETQNTWTLVIDGTARSAIEAAMVSVVEPGERVLVPSFGRFGQLQIEIARRVGADVRVIEAPWGTVFTPEQIKAALEAHRPNLLAICHGETSSTMLQPLVEIGRLCRTYGVLLQVDATASLGGTPLPADAWDIDCITGGLQKCLAGPPGAAPITFSDRMANLISRRRHLEEGLRPADYTPETGEMIRSNYFDLAMIMDYWDVQGLNHHTEATTMLYAARECARLFCAEGAKQVFARHALAGRALVVGVEAMGLHVFGDLEHKIPHIAGVEVPDGVNGERVRHFMLQHFGVEIGSAFGPLRGKIWRIGTMGYNARKDAVLVTLAALDAALAAEGVRFERGAGMDAALALYEEEE
ncbi:MAG TPA: alanine--glyoxylate aminotransferase family protein [Candidatus Baltobacteraceae bacterium]|nr:alanine--glyoxylate aminotransferase family protein [Candidatus Baltobacteraceae bacterium]